MEISRNEFIKTLGLAGFTVLGLPPVLSITNSLESQFKNNKSKGLTFQFRNPPDESQSWVWWRWLNGAASKKGITTDLEAMHDKGIGGAVVFDSGEVDRKVQNGPPFMGDEWRELFKHVLHEADRLGIVISVNVCSGWNVGGPWVTPGYAGKMLKATPIIIKGPKKVHLPPLQTDESVLGGSGVIAVLAMPLEEGVVDPFEIKLWDATSAQDLTSCIGEDDSFEWEAPAGSWMLLKMDYYSYLHPVANPGSLKGIEIDRYSAEAMDLHFSETGAKLAADAGPLVGRVLQYFSIDSLEGGRTTWTRNFREEFINRRGYDPLMELPAVVGYTLADKLEHDRFMRDYNQTCADLLADNFYRRFRELTLKEGLKGTTCEAGLPGSNLVDPLKCLGMQDVPMSEFWKRQYEPDGPVVLYAENTERNIKLAASAAHTYGKRICQAEAFTSLADNFTAYPWAMKDIGDSAFCDGLTRMVFHSYVAQVDHEKKPGIFWDHIGIDLSCNESWWPMAEGWLTYLSRCQYMLSQGLFIADFAYLMPDLVSGVNYNVTTPLPGQFDYMNSEVLLERASVKDGRLVLPDSMSYRYLCMPDGYLESRTLKRIKELSEQGLRVMIDTKHYQDIGIKFHDLKTAAKVHKPDVVIFNHPEVKNFKWIHRRDGETDIYFISNQSKNLKDEIELKVTFRVTEKQAELWDPVTGEIKDLPEFEKTKDGRITVPLLFAPRQSFFLVFRKKFTRKPGGRNFPELKSLLELTGEWKVEFDKKWFYGKDGKAIPNIRIFQKLEDWTSRPEDAVKYYSGIATYRKLFDLPASRATRKEQLCLNLGNVKDLARVRLNGSELGIVWTAPWQVKLPADLLKAKGNELEIEIANRWPNRLIGDGLFPKEQRRTQTNVSTYETPLPKKLIPTSNWARSYCSQCKERLESEKPAELLPSGLLGPVRLMREVENEAETK